MSAPSAAVARFVIALTFDNRIAKLAPALAYDRDASEQNRLAILGQGDVNLSADGK